MAARTAKQKAALRKAQLASAKKRKRRASVRNVGRGVVGSKRGSRKFKYRALRAGGALVAAGATAAAVHHVVSKDYRFAAGHGKDKGGKRAEYMTSHGGGRHTATATVRLRGRRYGVAASRRH